VAQTRESVEEAARNLRYGCFERLMAEGHADSVLTAHTLDDQAETVLMKLIRGAWTEGISGIHQAVAVDCGGDGSLPGGARGMPRKGRIVRPLLAARRNELRTYLESLGQPWREDSSNTDEAFTRNRIRHTILPMLREENPAIDRALANLAELAREDEARWQAELARILPQVLLPGKPVRGGGRAVSGGANRSVAIELERLRAMDPALRRRVVRSAARQLGARLSFDETARLLAFAGLQSDAAAGFTAGSGPGRIAPAKSGLQFHAGLRVERSPRELRFHREEPAGD
jgi:tRNA(Ile)-lysidine synthase